MKTAKEMVEQSLDSLYKNIDKEKLETVIQRVEHIINEKSKEGLFQCVITNDTLEELFLDAQEECFDDNIILYLVNILKEAGYQVMYEEIIYDNVSNLLEISW